jgi:hypothetical protein
MYEMRSDPRSVKTTAASHKKRALEIYQENTLAGLRLDARRVRFPLSYPGTGMTYPATQVETDAEFPCAGYFSQENAAAIAEVDRMNTSHQPNTTARQVPRETFVKQEKAMPASNSVQMVKTSTDSRRV